MNELVYELFILALCLNTLLDMVIILPSVRFASLKKHLKICFMSVIKENACHEIAHQKSQICPSSTYSYMIKTKILENRTKDFSFPLVMPYITKVTIDVS